MKKIHYGWIMTIFGAVILAVNSLPVYGFGIFLTPLTNEFGWQRGVISGAVSLAMLINGVLAIVTGRLCDRYGPRIWVTNAGIFLGTGLLLMSQVNSLWQLYLFWGMAVGVGLSGTVIPITSTIPRWFNGKRGLALSIPATGFGVGAVIAPLIIQSLVSNLDWRMAFLVIGLVPLAVTVPVAQFIRKSPAQMGLTPYEDNSKHGETVIPGDRARGYSFREAFRSRKFWILGMINFGFGVCMQTITVHIVPHGIDTGISATTAALFLTAIASSSVPAKFFSGFISDKIGSVSTLFISMTLMALSLAGLIFIDVTGLFFLFALLFGISYGLAVPLWVIVAADLFGVESLGIISGTLFFFNVTGGAIGAPLSGWIFDITGSYTTAFKIVTVVSTITVIMSLLLRRYRARRSSWN